MQKKDILKKLKKKEVVSFLKNRGISKLSLFGSWARDEGNENSDIDLLYKQKLDFCIGWDFFDIQNYLSEMFDKKVDLVEEKYLNHRIKKSILSEKVDIL